MNAPQLLWLLAALLRGVAAKAVVGAATRALVGAAARPLVGGVQLEDSWGSSSEAVEGRPIHLQRGPEQQRSAGHMLAAGEV